MNKSITGVLTQLREEGFELSDDVRHRHEFTLAPDVVLEAGELTRLQRERIRVTVEYDDEMPEVPPHIAHRIVAAPSPRE